MKRLVSLLALVALPVLAQTSQPLVSVGGAIKTIPAGNGLQIPSMAGSGARCVQADALGTLTVATGPCASGGSGSVTSVAVSGGTTGLTTTGGPITSSGTITLGGTLGVANGGTGSTTASGARTNLGVAIGTDVQAYSANLAAYAGGDTPSTFTLGIVDSADAAAWRSALGIAGGTGTVTSVDASGGTTGLSFTGGPVTSSGTLTLGGTLGVANGGTGATTLTGYVKGSGTSAFTATSSVPGSDVSGNIAGNAANVTGTVAIANGGTGATTASAARSGLGLAIGSDVQAYSGNLAAYAGGDAPSAFTLGVVDSVDAAAWRTAIGAGTSSTTGTVTSVALSGGTTGLTVSGSPITTSGTMTLGGTLGLTNGGTGGTDAATARTGLGLGTAATQNTGTSGANVPLLSNAANTWSGGQTFFGNLNVNKTSLGSEANLNLNADAGLSSRIVMQTAGSTRWSAGKNTTAESGSNVGSDYQIARYSDAGAYLDAAMTIARSSGSTTFGADVRVNRSGTSAQYLNILGDSGANWLHSYTDPAAAKTLVLNATTDASNTAPTGGSVGLSFRVRGTQRMSIDDAGAVSMPGAVSAGSLALTTDLAVADGGTGASTASAARTNLGLGTAATVNTGTSGATIPLLNGTNTWSAAQTLSSATVNGSLVVGNTVSTGTADIELGQGRTGSGHAFIDLHSVSGTDYEGRIIRRSGANGTFDIEQTGTGNINLIGNVVASGTLSASNLTSGTYTPTLTNVANAGSLTSYVAQYMRVGNVVTVSGKIDVGPSAASTLTKVGLTIPVASNLAAQQDLAGTSTEAVLTTAAAGFVGADGTNDRAQLEFYPTSTGARGVFYTFTYRVQ